jgi:hypothetical protein
MTQNGPAIPRMEKLGAAAGLLTMLTCCAASADESMRERAEESLFWRREADFLEAAGFVMREARRLGEETEAWRSCVQSPLMLALGAGAVFALEPPSEARWGCWAVCQSLHACDDGCPTKVSSCRSLYVDGPHLLGNTACEGGRRGLCLQLRGGALTAVA